MTRGKVWLTVGVACVFWALAAWPAGGQTLKSLVMPGPLSQAHAKFESDCTRCHTERGNAQEDTLCLACHKPVGEDMAAGKGFHGRIPAAGRQCRTCHTEHKGRDADIVGLNTETFNHQMTDFPLLGAHAQAVCSQCHVEGKKFREAPSDCKACHADKDVHKGTMGDDCSQCHSPKSWRVNTFDHSKTQFPLVGAHAKVACTACHANKSYKEAPKECVGCHAVNDAHQGRFGRDCQTCHSPKDWKTISFDHARDTKFPLRGQHANLTCQTCHTRPLGAKPPLPTACADCHAGDDVHKGRNGPDCQACHSERDWKRVSFDHAKDAHFALLGAHAHLACTECHQRSVKQVKLGTGCIDCHAQDDPHKGQLGRDCKQCHGVAKWDANIRFDHGLTTFPLLGLHAAVACQECHLTQAFADADSQCAGCHADDDYHHGGMGTDCAACHTPNGWAIWQFDHATQTKFALTGQHQKLACAACHTAGTKPADVGTDCVSCHAGDDKHAGRFGKQCDRCHTTADFKDIRIQR